MELLATRIRSEVKTIITESKNMYNMQKRRITDVLEVILQVNKRPRNRRLKQLNDRCVIIEAERISQKKQHENNRTVAVSVAQPQETTRTLEISNILLYCQYAPLSGRYRNGNSATCHGTATDGRDIVYGGCASWPIITIDRRYGIE